MILFTALTELKVYAIPTNLMRRNIKLFCIKDEQSERKLIDKK